MYTANRLRSKFIEHFTVDHGHAYVPSSPVYLEGDSSLLFVNAGMNQFKDCFLGTKAPPSARVANSQKCIRISGKHNDFNQVGLDGYHHTFFEMLGNWSFCDYEKEQAIRLAWQFLVGKLGIDKSRLYVTVFAGDPRLGLPTDEETCNLWQKSTSIDHSHILYFGKEDNFWQMGDSGPCGPCTEIHIDLTPDKSGGQLVNSGDPRVIELWNLVFIQHNMLLNGVLVPLSIPKHSMDVRFTEGWAKPFYVDTGMGLERLVAVMQNKSSNYDTDLFVPIILALEEEVDRPCYGSENPSDVTFRVVADHLRMLCFAISDGVAPENKERGSLVRTVLRRATRFAYQHWGQRDPFMFKIVPVVVGVYADSYNAVYNHMAEIQKIVEREERDFLKTIKHGLKLFEKSVKKVEDNTRIIPGQSLFDLHTAHGFPPDLVKQMASERGLDIDEDAYNSLMDMHKQKSKGADCRP